jgi:hypothetical protein
MRIQTSRKKQTALNLNIYRNLHHRSNNALKVKFKELAEKRLKGMPQLGRIRLHYSICPKSKRRLDIGNVGSIVDKFFSDVLTESGIIEDDDFTRLDFVSFGFGGLAKEEHVLVTITEIEERTNMKLSMTAQLSADDIREAAAAWVSEQTGQAATASDIVLSADVTAVATLGDASASTTTKPATKVKRRTKAQIEADNKAAEEAETNATTDDATVPDSTDVDGGGSDQNSEEEADTPEQTSKKFEADCKAEDEGKQSKNDSAESPEESSKGTDETADATEETPAPVKKKKSSIFAQ